MRKALYMRPTELSKALAALRGRPRSVLARGTAFYPARLGNQLDEDVLDAINDTRAITREGPYWRTPMLTTRYDVAIFSEPPK